MKRRRNDNKISILDRIGYNRIDMEENSPNQNINPIQYSQSSRPERPQRRSKQAIGDILSVLFIFAVAGALAFALIAFVFQSYQVDGPSMENTLQNNDRLIVWKVPRTWAHITGHQYVPNRGDIIIFNENNLAEFGQPSIKQLVKRVIGLPGDRVVVRNGVVTIYNHDHMGGFQPDQTLPYGQEHPLPYTSGDIDITLDSTHIFVCGDNRTDSLDSRAFGPVDLNDVVGKLVLRMFPLSTLERF